MSRGISWWVRSALVVLVPAGVGCVAASRGLGTAPAVVLALLALVGAIFVFQPDTWGWKLSLTSWFVAGEDPGPSHLWRVWARMSGLFLLAVCVAIALLMPAAGPLPAGCTVQPDGSTYCNQVPTPEPGDLEP